MAPKGMPDFNFASGSKEIEAEAEKNRPSFDRFRPGRPLKWNEEEPRHMVRFLDDDKFTPDDPRHNTWKGVQIHTYVATVPKPEEFEGRSWPPGMSAVCRYESAFGGYFPNCVICDDKLTSPDGKDSNPQQRMFARVVLREKVLWAKDDPDLPNDQKIGKLKGIRDKTKDVKELGPDGKPTGRQIKVPDIRMVEQSRKLFFQNLIGIAQQNMEDNDDDPEAYTVLDRDFSITRSGKGTGDTAYAINPVKNSERMVGEAGQTVVIDGEVVDLEGVTWDVRDPRVLAYYEQFLFWSLPGYFIEQASDEHHERFFVPGGYAKWKESRNEDSDEEAKPAKKASSKAKTRPAPADDDEDDEEEPPARPAKKSKPASPPVDDEDDDEDDEPPAKPAKKAKPAPAPADDDEDDDEEEDDGPPSGQLAKYRSAMQSTAPEKRQRVNSAMDDDEDEDDEAMQPV